MLDWSLRSFNVADVTQSTAIKIVALALFVGAACLVWTGCKGFGHQDNGVMTWTNTFNR